MHFTRSSWQPSRCYNSLLRYGCNLAVAAVLLVCSVEAAGFLEYADWLQSCSGSQVVSSGHSTCSLPIADLLQFVSAVTADSPPSLPTETYTATTAAACNAACLAPAAAAFDSATTSFAPAASCPYFRNGSQLATISEATRQLMCTTRADGSDPGICVIVVAAALRKVQLLTPIRSMSDSLQIEGADLEAACQALVPLQCCFSSAMELLGSAARQLCRDNLATVLLGLPGRCQALTGAAVSAACNANVTSALAPLMQPRADCGASMPDVWAGTMCSGTQLMRTGGCSGSACDLWCGLLGAAAQQAMPVAKRSPPPPAPHQVHVPSRELAPGATTFIIVMAVLLFLLFGGVVCYKWQRRRLASQADAEGKYAAMPAELAAYKRRQLEVEEQDQVLRAASTLISGQSRTFLEAEGRPNVERISSALLDTPASSSSYTTRRGPSILGPRHTGVSPDMSPGVSRSPSKVGLTFPASTSSVASTGASRCSSLLAPHNMVVLFAMSSGALSPDGNQASARRGLTPEASSGGPTPAQRRRRMSTGSLGAGEMQDLYAQMQGLQREQMQAHLRSSMPSVPSAPAIQVVAPPYVPPSPEPSPTTVSRPSRFQAEAANASPPTSSRTSGRLQSDRGFAPYSFTARAPMTSGRFSSGPAPGPSSPAVLEAPAERLLGPDPYDMPMHEEGLPGALASPVASPAVRPRRASASADTRAVAPGQPQPIVIRVTMGSEADESYASVSSLDIEDMRRMVEPHAGQPQDLSTHPQSQMPVGIPAGPPLQQQQMPLGQQQQTPPRSPLGQLHTPPRSPTEEQPAQTPEPGPRIYPPPSRLQSGRRSNDDSTGPSKTPSPTAPTAAPSGSLSSSGRSTPSTDPLGTESRPPRTLRPRTPMAAGPPAAARDPNILHDGLLRELGAEGGASAESGEVVSAAAWAVQVPRPTSEDDSGELGSLTRSRGNERSVSMQSMSSSSLLPSAGDKAPYRKSNSLTGSRNAKR